jgi:DNA-directed RNA polymerase specialized sigma24 family protein
MSPTPVDWTRCEALAARAADGDAAARRELMEALWPTWLGLVRGSRAMGPLARSEDDVHDVLTKLVEKLGRADGHGLRLYRSWIERHPEKTFEDWICIVVANAVRDHVRRQLGEAKGPPSTGEPSIKRLLNEFASSPALERLGVRPPLTAAQTARQLLEFARERLPADQYGALTRWIDGATFEEIEEELGLREAGAGRKLVRAAVAVVRRHFVVP